MNKGHRLARGKYLTWTSDDNLLHKEQLSTLKSALDNNPVSLVYSSMRVIEPDGTFRRDVPVDNPAKSLFGSVVGASFLYRREVFEKLQGYDESKYLIEDFDFWLRASIHFQMMQVQEILYDYRSHPGSLSKKISEDKSLKSVFDQRLRDSYNVLVKEMNFSQQTVDYLIAVHLHDPSVFEKFCSSMDDILDDLRIYVSHLNDDFEVVRSKVVESLRASWINNKESQNRTNLFMMLRKFPAVFFDTGINHRNSIKIIFNSLLKS